jgi:hypothetical protein
VRPVGLEELDDELGAPDGLQTVAEHQALARLTDMIRRLLSIDPQVVLAYLKGMDAEPGAGALHVDFEAAAGMRDRLQDAR